MQCQSFRFVANFVVLTLLISQVKIARDVGLRPLIELLSSSVIEIQEQAVIALRNLCANSENQTKVRAL